MVIVVLSSHRKEILLELIGEYGLQIGQLWVRNQFPFPSWVSAAALYKVRVLLIYLRFEL